MTKKKTPKPKPPAAAKKTGKLVAGVGLRNLPHGTFPYVSAGGPSKDEVIEQNRRMLGELPPFPVQPVIFDEHGTTRFRRNRIVEYLLDHGGIDLNHLARQNFPAEDRQQFAQLIGYSLSGYGELSYVDDKAFAQAIEAEAALLVSRGRK